MAETQLPIFSQECLAPEPGKKSWKLFIDGASRNNPGPAGAGVYLLCDDEVVFQEGFFLGSRTNNQAEYVALLLGIFFVRVYGQPDESVCIVSDSQLLVRQMIGQYRVRNIELQKLQNVAFALLKGYEYRFCHVMREQNKQADKLANKGIDKKVPLPGDFVKLLHAHEIPF